MNNTIQENLERKIDELKSFISKFNAESVLRMIMNDLSILHDETDIFRKTELSSPYKQYMYLAGLIISTNAEVDIDMDKENFDKTKKMLEDITNLYAISFFPTEEEIINSQLDEYWYRKRQVSMSVFLDYFNTSVLNYEEQEEARIRRWFEPFNDFFIKKFKFSVNELLEIYNYIVTYLRNQLKETQYIYKKLCEEHKKFFININNGMTEEDAIKQVDGEFIKKFWDIMQNRYITQNVDITQNVGRIFIKDLKDKFGEDIIESFLNEFSLNRDPRKFRYYTEENPFEKSPLLREGDEYVFCCVYKQLLHAIFDFLYRELEKSNKKDKFYNRRDLESEKQAEELLKNIFGDRAKFFSSVFETNDSQNEHDLFVIYDDVLVIGEIKASKVKEPFRDPERAYIRIERDFKSDKGIQKAYNQGLKLKELILSQEETTLYDKKGNEIININRNDYKKIYILCITAENYSILATHLAFLLEKPKNESYPWACNLHDLETICNAFKYKGLNSDKFLQYLDERSELQENLIASDELEICGYFLKEGSLKNIKSKIKGKDGMMIFTANMSDIFDDIYYEQKGIDIKTVHQRMAFDNINPMMKGMLNKNFSLNKINRKKRQKKKKMSKLSRKKNRKK